eukprot:scaffold129827_cov33-Phaeocystis_antarctica.AAC.1
MPLAGGSASAAAAAVSACGGLRRAVLRRVGLAKPSPDPKPGPAEVSEEKPSTKGTRDCSASLL